MKSQIAALQTKIDAGKYITGVTATADGVTITLSDGTSHSIKNGAAGQAGEAGSKLTIDENGQWLIDDEATGWYCSKKGETATVIVPEVGTDGYWYFVNKETGELEKSTIKATPVSVVEANGICTLTVVNADGTTTTVKLPTVAASITSLSFISTDGTAVVTDYKMNWGHSLFNNNDWKGAKGKISQGQLLLSTINTLYVQVIPSTADLSVADLKFVGSNGAVAPVKVVATPYTGAISRAASESGVWKLDVLPAENLTVSNIATAFQFWNGVEMKDYAYALQVNGTVLTGYTTKAVPNEYKATTLSLAKTDFSQFDATAGALVIDAGKEVTIKYNQNNAYDAYMTIDKATEWEAKGVKMVGNTMTITSPAALAGTTGPTVKIHYVNYQGKEETAIPATIKFNQGVVSADTQLADVAYKVGDNYPNVIINMGTFFTGMSAADAVTYAKATWNWAAPTDTKATYFMYDLNTASINYYKELNADGTDGNKQVTDLSSADAIRTIKYVVIKGASYQTTAKTGAHTLNFTISKDTELKKASVNVNVSLPTWNELFTNSKAFNGSVLNAMLAGTDAQYLMTNAFIKKNASVDFDNLYLVSDKDGNGAAYATYSDATHMLTMNSNVLNSAGAVSKNVKMTGYYAIGGLKRAADPTYGNIVENNNFVVEVPAFEVKFMSPFNDVKFTFYKDNAVLTEVPVTLDAAGNATIALYNKAAGTAAAPKQGLAITASNKTDAFSSNTKLYNETYKLEVEDVADGAKAEPIADGIKLTGMATGASYTANIKITIADASGIKTVVKLPISVK